MPYVLTRAGRVFYAERGEGPPVVLLHATLHEHRDFDAVAGPLAAAGYRVLAVDWPGHGNPDAVLDAGHVVFATDPDGFLAQVRPFLMSVSPAGRPR
jgi:alpha-beta hydrolase superfamily lysophospholipase